MYNNNEACKKCIEERAEGEYEKCVYNNKDCHNFIVKHSIKSCESCGCIFIKEECPICKLQNELPSIIDDLKDQMNERGIYSPDY